MLDVSTSFVPFPAPGEQLIVVGFCMPDVCNHGKLHGLLIESFRRFRATNSPAVLQTGMFSPGTVGSGRACRKELANPLCKLLHVLSIEFRATFGLSLTAASAHVGIGKALRLRLLQSCLLDQDALALIPLAGTAPLEHHGG
jgi:hypothetical protein